MRSGIYWCDNCSHPVKTAELKTCPACGQKIRYLTTDARPVFARERRILQFYGHGHLTDAALWKSSKSVYYYINGQTIALPKAEQIKNDLPAIAAYINDSDHYDALDEQLIADYRRQLAVNQIQLNGIEDEAVRFIRTVDRKFQGRMRLVSFSGGKDSSVVSDLVVRTLGSNVIHIFNDTTLEDPNTYDYIRQFRESNPLIHFWEPQAEHDFHKLVDQIGPPSRVMRWCCTIFKVGPINYLLQTFPDHKVLTFYGIRADESLRRGGYDRITISGVSDKALTVDKESELYAIPSATSKMGQQVTAAPILNWSEFDVWLYILYHGLLFNKSYRLGFSRVGCWLCPLNSRWSEILTGIFFPEDADRWRSQLINFARRIGKPDPEEYVDDRAWVKRFGGAGLPNRFVGLEAKPCGEMDDTLDVTVERPINVELEEFLKPLGKINRGHSRPGLGEIYLEARPSQQEQWTAIVVQALEGDNRLRVTVINPKDRDRVFSFIKYQATKFQTCIQCTACSAVCPHGAITIKPDMRVYEIDQDVCTGCMECVTHFGSTGCLVAKSLSVYGNSNTPEDEVIPLVVAAGI
jgi:phosphoadenosine phosphosulfate reductase